MQIRRAEEKDIEKLIVLLQEVLEIHAALRPDIFISGTTKYTAEELQQMILDDEKPIYVAADDEDAVVGYAFCQIKEFHNNNMHAFKMLYIDDLCVDQNARGQHVGATLFEYVKSEAKRLNCREVVLNVWEGNENAKHFYEKVGMKIRSMQMEYLLD